MSVPAPDTLDEALSPAWLTAALGTAYPGVVVTAVHAGLVDDRVSTNALFRIEVQEPAPVGLPLDLCLKGYFGVAGRAASSVGVVEACCYRDLLPHTGVRTLPTVYADVDVDKGLGVVITADVVARGCTFPDPRTAASVDQVAEGLSQLAILHAATWQSPRWADLPWLAPKMRMLSGAGRTGVVHASFEGAVGAGIPERVRDPEALLRAYDALSAEVEGLAGWSVMHGDTHLGNVFLDADGRPSFLDWQLVQRGAWYVDVSYHLASSLDVEQRRAHERDLLAHYLDRLAAGGVAAITADDAWSCVRRGVVHGLFLWSITQRVDPAKTTALLTRLGTAADDYQALTRCEI